MRLYEREADPIAAGVPDRLRFLSALATVCVLVCSLALLTYVGFGEARRTYSTFVMDKLAAQAEIVQNGVSTFLLADLPLDQFPGFATQTTPLLESDKSITTIYIVDSAGKLIFANPAQPGGTFVASRVPGQANRYSVRENDSLYDVVLPLKNRFESVGTLHITTAKAVITDKINPYFVNVAFAALLVAGGFGLLIFRTTRTRERPRLLVFSYTLAFVLMSAVVVFTLVSVYSDGIQNKTQALANSLSQRLNAPLALGLSLSDFGSLDKTFDDYRSLNPDLSFVTLTSGTKILTHTDERLNGTTYQADPDQYEYTVSLSGQSDGATLAVRLGIPRSVVVTKLWRGIKNFVALFIASILLSTLFFNLIRSVSTYAANPRTPTTRRAFRLGLIAPLYFIGVFADSLTNSFLPQHFRELAVRTGADPAAASNLFTIYFTAYALALVIATPISQRWGIKALFLTGALLTLAELLTLAFVPNFYALFAVEFMAGLGQGTIFIGAQSYILSIASSTRRTRSAAIIVFGFNGGVLSAVAIGGLLAADPALGRQGVFIIGGIIATLVFFYAYFCVPNVLTIADDEVDISTDLPPVAAPVEAHSTFGQRLGRAVTDPRFMQTTFFIGIPTKIIMSGLITATLPLLLARQSYQTEDIAQLIMFYSGAVLLSSRVVAGIADRTGRVGLILFCGACMSGIGLILIGLMDWSGLGTTSSVVETLLVIGGLVALGTAHGFIQAPVITYIAATPTAAQLGKTSTTSLYRLFERIGNIGGPIIVTQMLVLSDGSATAVSVIGLSVIVLGVFFAARLPRPASPMP